MNKSIKDLLVLHFLNDGVRSTYLVLLPFIAKDFNFSLSLSGFLGSSLSLSSALLAIPSGFAVAKLGGYKLIGSLLVIYSVASILVGISPNFIFLLLAFLLGSLGFGLFHSASFTIVAKNSEDSNVGTNMGNFTAIGDIGRSAIPPLSVFLTAIIGWRITIGLIGIIGILYYIFLRFIKIKEVSTNQHLQENRQDFVKELLNFFRVKAFLYTCSAAILDSFASSPLYIFLPFLFLFKNVSTQELGILMFGFFIGSFAGKVVLGRGIDKFGNSKVFIISELFMALCLILSVVTSLFPVLLLLSFLLGVFTKGTSPVVQTMFSKHSHRDHYNKVFGISETFIAFSAFLAQIFMGITADKFGITSIFYLCAILALLATLPVFLLPAKKLGKDLNLALE